MAPRCTPVGDGIRPPAGQTAYDRAVADAAARLGAVPAPTDRSPALAEAVASRERIGAERVDAGGQLQDPGVTATEPDARRGAKGRNRHWTGYKATVVEDPATELLFNIPIPPGNVPDDQVLPAALEGVTGTPVEVLGDWAYGTRRNRRWDRDRRIRLVAPRKGQGRGRVIGRILQPADRARRAQGERKHAEGVRWHGFRQARYVGWAKVPRQAYRTAAWAHRKRRASLLRTPAPQPAAAEGPRLPGRPRNPRKLAPGGLKRQPIRVRSPENPPSGGPEASPGHAVSYLAFSLYRPKSTATRPFV
ncbi:protein of unknown function [Candidatus Hydrogenisulfobacillus filiaventi]|uniref:Transposase IS4-like domain-containing protein n=1 Tax=Candidatus Hydrogenisulfobacillus filiaventi TaxID=2707344 RepID=A0A6F8ZDL6_9FIRM|nr:protein of unknown function [Candidatus Hydrogenisulfobacillus filiaventi]